MSSNRDLHRSMLVFQILTLAGIKASVEYVDTHQKIYYRSSGINRQHIHLSSVCVWGGGGGGVGAGEKIPPQTFKLLPLIGD